MEQEPDQDPETDGPTGPQPPPGSSHPGDTGVPGPGASSPGASSADAGTGDGDGDGDDQESVFGPWDALEGHGRWKPRRKFPAQAAARDGTRRARPTSARFRAGAQVKGL